MGMVITVVLYFGSRVSFSKTEVNRQHRGVLVIEDISFDKTNRCLYLISTSNFFAQQ